MCLLYLTLLYISRILVNSIRVYSFQFLPIELKYKVGGMLI